MTYNHPQSSKDTAELARWLWPCCVNLDWDGRVTVQLPNDQGWRTFSPLSGLSYCLQAAEVFRERDLLHAFVKELEVQLHKLRSVKPRFTPGPALSKPLASEKISTLKSTPKDVENPAWVEEFLLLLASDLFLPEEEDSTCTETEAQDSKQKDLGGVWWRSLVTFMVEPYGSWKNRRRSEENAIQADWLMHFVRRLVKDDETAEGIVMEVMAKALTEDSEMAHDKRWLAAQARTIVIENMRKSQRRCREECLATERGADYVAHVRTRAIQVLAAIEKLPQEHQQVLLLRQMVGLNPQQIAQKLGFPLERVSRLLARANRQVQEIMKDSFRVDWPMAFSSFERWSWVPEQEKPILSRPPVVPEIYETDSDSDTQGTSGSRDQDTILFVGIAIQRVGGGPKVANLITRWVQVLKPSLQRIFLMRYFANMRLCAIGELLGLSAEQVDSKVNLCFAEIEHAMRVCGEHDVLLSQITSALLCVARDHPLPQQGEI